MSVTRTTYAISLCVSLSLLALFGAGVIPTWPLVAWIALGAFGAFIGAIGL